MAEQDTGVNDAPLDEAMAALAPDEATPDLGSEADAEGAGGSDEGEVVEEESPFLSILGDDGTPVHTYKTVEDAQKTFREKESMLGKQAARVRELEAQLARVDQEKRLSQLEKATQSATTAAQEAARKAQLDELREQLATDPGKALDLMTQQDEYYSRKLQELEQSLSSRFEEKLLRQTDDYTQHKETVDVLMSKGLSFADAMDVAKTVAPTAAAPKATQPPRPQPPRAPTPKAPNKSSKPRGDLSPIAAAVLENMGFGSLKDGVAASIAEGVE